MMALYKLVVVGSLAAYAATGLLGLEVGSEKRQPIPQSVRQSPGGYRSFHFWHTGFHGGK